MKTYCFDIDGTICTNTDGKYKEAKPFLDRIHKINLLYDQDKIIILHSARGSTTGINWYMFTTKQLKDWGVKYHLLVLGKPTADIYIDDKGIEANVFFEK